MPVLEVYQSVERHQHVVDVLAVEEELAAQHAFDDEAAGS